MDQINSKFLRQKWPSSKYLTSDILHKDLAVRRRLQCWKKRNQREIEDNQVIRLSYNSNKCIAGRPGRSGEGPGHHGENLKRSLRVDTALLEIINQLVNHFVCQLYIFKSSSGWYTLLLPSFFHNNQLKQLKSFSQTPAVTNI